MGNIKIIKGSFSTNLALEHAPVRAGFPSPADDYKHERLDFNKDYIKHPEASMATALSLTAPSRLATARLSWRFGTASLR